VYGSARKLSPAYYGRGPQDGEMQPLLQFDMTKAFWIQNMVSNLAYSRWSDIYPIVKQKMLSVHEGFADNIVVVDRNALQLLNDTQNMTAVINYLSLYTVNAGNTMQKLWTEFYGELFVQFRDYYNIVPSQSDPSCGCSAIEPGLSDTMKRRIVDETGDHYRVIETAKLVSRTVRQPKGQKLDYTVLSGENGPPIPVETQDNNKLIGGGGGIDSNTARISSTRERIMSVVNNL
jgi:hypothetical protein